jgi:predicted phage terminase large subunit-like protein
MTTHKNNLWGDHSIAWSLGEKSISFFCFYYLQDIFRVKDENDARQLADFHFELWLTLETMIITDEFDRLVLCLPRGHAKSTVVTFALVIWLACYKKSFYTIVQGKTEADGIKFLSDVRAAFENNEYIKKSFGALIDTKRFTINKNELHLANNSKIECLSSTSSLRGRKHQGKRPQYIICDDITGLDDCLSEQAKQKKLEIFQKDVLYAGDPSVFRDGRKIKPGTKFICLGTVLAENDFISSLLKDKTFLQILKRGMEVPEGFSDVDDYFTNNSLWSEFKNIYYNAKNPYAQIEAKEFYYEHEEEMSFNILWPDKYFAFDLALMYYSDPRGFKSEVMNDASKLGEKIFHQIKTISEKEMEAQNNEYVKTILVCDPAVETGAKNDYTAFCVGSKLANGFRYIRKGIINKLNFDDYISKVIELLKNYPDISFIWIEKNTFNSADEREIRKRIMEDIILSKRNIIIDCERQSQNKYNKIVSIAGKVDSGFIIFNEEDSDFCNQVLEYNEFAKHDDAPDALSEFDRLIDEVTQIHKLEFLDKRLLF